MHGFAKRAIGGTHPCAAVDVDWFDHHVGRGVPCGNRTAARVRSERASRLSGGSQCDVLPRFRDDHGNAEQVGRDALHGRRSGSTADQQDAAGLEALADQGVDPVGQPAQHALDGGAGEVLGCRVARVSPPRVPVALGRLGVRSPSR